MQKETEAKSEVAGMDWLTVTAKAGPVAELLHSRFDTIFPMVVGSEAPRQWFPGHGYRGMRCTHGGMAKRETDSMVVLSGYAAQKHGLLLLTTGAQASRVDLQVTLRGGGSPGWRVGKAYSEASAFHEKAGRRPEILMTVSPEGNRMVTFGSRVSERYGRVYDKYQQSKDEDYAGCVRYELEYKGSMAKQVAGWCITQGAAPDAIARQVAFEYRGYGVTCQGLNLSGGTKFVAAKRPASVDSRMEWLRTQVSPAVLRMMDRVGLEGVVGALFGGGFDDKLIDVVLWDQREESHG